MCLSCACTAESDEASSRTLRSARAESGGRGGTTTQPPADNSQGASSFDNSHSDGSVMNLPCGGKPCPVPDAGSSVAPVPDDDGFSVADGDCDDFSDVVNPGAYDVPNNGIDEDCKDGDATSDGCDDALGIDASDPLAAASAIELCARASDSDRRWGVISARWTTPAGTGEPGSTLMRGLLPSLGPSFAPRGGKTMLALSSGVARAPDQIGFTANCSEAFPTDGLSLPQSFDGVSSSCPKDTEPTSIVDAIALEVRVRMPTNATSLSFDSAFFTHEYPNFICTRFNDFFQVLVDPMRMGASPDGNVVFDLDGNAVSVNNSLLRACNPGEYGGKKFDCPLGFMPLMGTGYDTCGGGTDPFLGVDLGGTSNGAATGWLVTELAVKPAEIVTLRFAIWDSGDSSLDSLALIDHVQFRVREKEKEPPPPPEKPKTMPVVPE